MSATIALSATEVLPSSMATIKSSFSMDEDLYKQLEMLTKTTGETASALISEGVEWVVARRSGLAAMAEYQAEHGAFTAKELAEAGRTIDELFGSK